MNITLNLEKAEEFIKSDKFAQFLLNNTTDFSVATFVLETLFKELEKLQAEE